MHSKLNLIYTYLYDKFLILFIQIEHETHVETRYGKVNIRKIHMKDKTGECRVTLWRNHASSPDQNMKEKPHSPQPMQPKKR